MHLSFSCHATALVAIATAAVFLVPASFAETVWETDIEAAKKKAADEDKDLFINFTGSDWCEFCITLKKTVFGTTDFLDGAAEGFVLVEVDFPQEKPQDKALKEQNETLRISFGIEGFPTLFLADSKGRPYGQIPSQPGITPDQFVAQMSSHQKLRKKRDEHFASAGDKKGLERAKALEAGLKMLSEEIVDRFYGATVDEIIELDEEDTLKLKAKRTFVKVLGQLELEVASLARTGDHDAIEKAIDTFIEERKLEKEEKQAALMLKLGLFGQDQLDGVVALLDTIIRLDPKSNHAKEAEEIRHRVEQYRKETRAKKEASTN
jgi:thioredoxin-related protein